MLGLSNNQHAANTHDENLREVAEIFSLYSKCLDNKGWDKYLVNTLGLNTNKFSDLLKKEKEDDNRGVNAEYEKLLDFLENNVLEKFEKSVPSQFSRKEVFKLLLSAIFQSSIDGIHDPYFKYDDIKAELNSYINELKKSMEEVESVQEDETKDEDDVSNTLDAHSSKLNEILSQSKRQYKVMQNQKLNVDDTKSELIHQLSLFIDVEKEIIPPPKLWRKGETVINPREDDFFLSHMVNDILNINNQDENAIINQMESTTTSNPQVRSTRSSHKQDADKTKQDNVEKLYGESKDDFITLENEVFETARRYINDRLNDLDGVLGTFEEEKRSFIETFRNQLTNLKFEPLQCFGKEAGDPVYTRSYKTTLLRKVVEILSQVFKSAGFLISEKIVKLIKNMRKSEETLDIKQDPLILRLLYKSYLYITNSVRDLLEQQNQDSLLEAICDKYQINDNFRDIIKDTAGSDGESLKMAIAFAFNNNVYF